MTAIAPTTDSLANAIQSTPGTCGGKPRIAGTRIRVVDVYVEYVILGHSPAEIQEAYPKLSLGDIHAALAYYYKHAEEIESDYAGEELAVAELKQKLGPGPLEQRQLERQQP
jgi:uncharacterized protein (DUF433 family)